MELCVIFVNQGRFEVVQLVNSTNCAKREQATIFERVRGSFRDDSHQFGGKFHCERGIEDDSDVAADLVPFEFMDDRSFFGYITTDG